MPNGIAVTRMMPRNSKPRLHLAEGRQRHREAEVGKGVALDAEAAPIRGPNRLEPHAMTIPTRDRRQGAGMFFQYFTPPNQLTMMMAKQIRPDCGVMCIPAPAASKMKVRGAYDGVPATPRAA